MFFSSMEIENIHEIKKQHFMETASFKVKKIQRKNREYYFIRVFEYIDTEIDDLTEIKQDLGLTAKGVLFNYLKKKDKNIKSIQLKNFVPATYWTFKNRLFLLSYVATDKVLINPKKIKKQLSYSSMNESKINNDQKKSQHKANHEQVVNIDDYTSIIDKKIKQLLSITKSNPKSIDAHQALYELYLLNHDIDNADKTMDKLMELKFLYEGEE